MIIKFKMIDKIICLICLLTILVCWLILTNLNNFHALNSEGEKIGRISTKGEDVRKKISSEYFWEKLLGADDIRHGDSFFAGKSSAATISLADGVTLQLKENSLVKFTGKNNKLSIDIAFGQVRVSSEKRIVVLNDCGKEIEIESINAVFDIDKGKDCGDIQIKVNSGRIKIAKKVVDSQVDLSHHQSKVFLDKILKIMDSPKMDSPKNVKAYIQMAQTCGLEFFATWDTIRNASEYEIEISPDSKLQRDKKNFSVKENRFLLAPVESDKLYYRLKVKNGEFGAIGVAELRQNMGIPKIQQSELSLLNINELALNLRWLALEKADQYRVEVSETADFTLAQTQTVPDLTVNMRALKKSKVYVRVRAENRFIKGSFSEPVLVTLGNEKIEVPRFKSAALKWTGSDLVLDLSWSPIEKATAFQIEVSETAAFSKPRMQVIKGNVARFSGQEHTAVFVRGRLENKFIKGPFSEPILVAYKYQATDSSHVLTENCPVLSYKDTGSKKDFNVDWPAVPMAQVYSVKIINSKKAGEAIQIQSRSPASIITVPACGDYDIKIDALDKAGRKISSEFNATKILYKAALFLLKPIIAEAQKNINIFFQNGESHFLWLKWVADVKPESIFRVELATNDSFTENLKQFDVRDSKLLIKSKFQGEKYFWRVREQKVGLKSEWSEVAQIKIIVNKPK